MEYSIGEVAARTGVKPPTLRAWERRYGVLRPGRSESLYRRYTDRDVDTVRSMNLLIASGVPARRAAAMAAEEPASHLPVAGVSSKSLFRDTSAVARAGAALDVEALRGILDEAFAIAAAEVVVDSWLMPSMQQVGSDWVDGSLDVVGEHVISAAVMRKLSALFEATPARGPRVVVGLPASSRHELPALAFELLLQRAGTHVMYAGCDVPVSCWTRVVQRWRPVAAVTAATCAHDVPFACAAVEALNGTGVKAIFVGGRAADQVRGGVPLPRSLAMAAESLALALASRQS